MRIEKMILTGLIGAAIIGMGFIGTSQLLVSKGKKVWEDKKEKLTLFDRIAYKWNNFLEEAAIGQLNTETEEKIKKRLIEIFDYIAVRNPNIKAANDYLEIETYMRITDYWDGPYGRIMEIEIKKDEKHPEIRLKINIATLANQVYGTKKSKEKEQKRPKLRIIKNIK